MKAENILNEINDYTAKRKITPRWKLYETITDEWRLQDTNNEDWFTINLKVTSRVKALNFLIAHNIKFVS